ncbi:MAG: glycerate kinase [Methylophilaceae bacterium]
MTLDHAQLLRRLFDAAIQAARPVHCLPPCLPPPPYGRTLVLGAGKASAAMAQALERHWQGALSGLVVTQYGHSVPCERIAIVEAAHPVPDEAGLAAARQMLALTNGLTADDLVICLFSGGGSALLPLPLDGLTLQDKQDVTAALLKSGASIREINCVRRHLSAIKGGRLAAACHPAQVLTLLISDVPGDDPVDIASGPTVGDPTTCEEALEILRRYRIDVTDCVQDILQSGRGETLKPDDPLFARSTVKIVATPHMALQAAAGTARQAGVMPLILGDAIEGEAREVGAEMAGRALHVASTNPLPCVLLSGGETTVVVTGPGRGGRNVEFLLALGLALDGHPGIYALAGDTDGMDGTEPIAGALLYPDSLVRAKALGLQARVSLHDNDAHGFFSALGDSVVTGPTLTNVNDFRAILVTPEAAG